MADSEVRQKFEAWEATVLKGTVGVTITNLDIFAAGMRAGEIAQRENAERNYARGFNQAVRDIVAALSRQFNQELNEERQLGLRVALNIASGYHGFMDAEKSVPAAPEEKK